MQIATPSRRSRYTGIVAGQDKALSAHASFLINSDNRIGRALVAGILILQQMRQALADAIVKIHIGPAGGCSLLTLVVDHGETRYADALTVVPLLILLANSCAGVD